MTVRAAPDGLRSGVDIGAGGLRYVGNVTQTTDTTKETAESRRWCIEVEALQGGGEMRVAAENDVFAWTTAAQLLPPVGLLAFARKLVEQEDVMAAMWLPEEKRCKVWPRVWQGDWETTLEVDMTVTAEAWRD